VIYANSLESIFTKTTRATREPLARDARRLAKKLSAECEVVLLGSIATSKYVDVFAREFSASLAFPSRFCWARGHEFAADCSCVVRSIKLNCGIFRWSALCAAANDHRN